MTRRATLLVVVASLLAAAVALLVDRGDPPLAEPTPTQQPAATETLLEQIERVTDVVVEVRELTVDTTPAVTVLTPGDLVARVAEDLVNYTAEDAEADRRLLVALRAIPAGYDLRDELVGALSEQVAGFYDPATQELVIGALDPDARVGRLEELTLAHEIQHALADAALGLPALDDEGLDDDALLAQRALVEGDATATMQAYAEVGFSLVDRAFLAQEGLALQEQLGSLTSLPHHLQRSLTLPYEAGLAFISALRVDGGWTAVDEAYADPPSTSAQVLFPDRYASRQAPTPLAPTRSPGPPWTPSPTVAVGAADLLLLFEAPGGDPERSLADPRGSASAWRGGEAAVWTDGDATAVSLALATDAPDRLCGDLRTWLGASRPQATVEEVGDLVRFSEPAETVALRCGPETRLGIAPTVETAELLTTAA